MMRIRLSLLTGLAGVILVTAGCVTPVPAPESSIEDDTVSFDRIDAVVSTLNDTYGSDEVLVVLDIDNTILTSSVDLGGDFWYQWQRGRLDVQPEPDQKVGCLFEDAIGLLYELGPMRITEASLPDKIRSWQDSGNTVFALTSRSPKYRAATERELIRAGVDLSRAALSPLGGSVPVYRDIADREWSYMQGVMMTTGMNKGKMLRMLLDRTGRDFSAIVFVDDTRRHVDHVFESFEGSDRTAVRVFHFTRIEAAREDAHGAVLTEQQAAKMAADWQRLNAVLNTVFPARTTTAGCLGTP
ncbi:MAG: DUF2608 domain-containing protein [Pseudomonadota bacterium]